MGPQLKYGIPDHLLPRVQLYHPNSFYTLFSNLIFLVCHVAPAFDGLQVPGLQYVLDIDGEHDNHGNSHNEVADLGKQEQGVQENQDRDSLIG